MFTGPVRFVCGAGFDERVIEDGGELRGAGFAFARFEAPLFAEGAADGGESLFREIFKSLLWFFQFFQRNTFAEVERELHASLIVFRFRKFETMK